MDISNRRIHGCHDCWVKTWLQYCNGGMLHGRVWKGRGERLSMDSIGSPCASAVSHTAL
jgi:hypothetical protein